MIDSIEITKTVGEILFDGYEDTLMNIANTLPKMPNINLPPFKKFGWFVDVSFFFYFYLNFESPTVWDIRIFQINGEHSIF